VSDHAQYEGDFAIQFQVRILHHSMTFETCNTWNSRWLFGACFLNPENELVIKSDLLLEGGVSGKAIARFVVEYLDLFDDLMKFDDSLEED
jgi:Putative bacterial sensory transduction regulator